MDFLESFNQSLFLLINADPATPAWRIHAAMRVANQLILLVPGVMAAVWLWGGQAQRSLMLKALASVAVALGLSYLCGA
ncbi:MAG: phosphatase PAP2 family protein, partial [Achromobacter mucicolens]